MKHEFLNTINKGLNIFIILGIIIVINFLSYNIFFRWDLTQTKDFSISKISKKEIAQLDDIINIKAYFSENVPSQYITLRQEVRDILEEYVVYSKGKIKYEFIDPKDNKEMQKELYLNGIPQVEFNVIEKDKYQVVNGYLGILVQYGDKKEVIPVVQSTENLEYDITMSIKKATGKIAAIIGMVTSHKTMDQENEISLARREIGKLYQIIDIDLKKEQKIPDIVNVLLIIGPKEKFEEKELRIIDSFLARDGSLFIAVDGIKIESGLAASSMDLGFNKLLNAYGIKVNQDVVGDESAGYASFTQGFLNFSILYPFWPKVTTNGFSKDNPATAKLESAIFPWISSIDILNDKINEGAQIKSLVYSTDKAWKQTEPFNLNPQMAESTKNKVGRYNFTVFSSGKFKTAFDKKETNNTRIVVVGDSDFINDNFLRNSKVNLVLFQNLVDLLALDEDLINIRSKDISERPLKPIDENIKKLIRYGNIFGITIIVITLGMIRYYLRRKRKIVDEI